MDLTQAQISAFQKKLMHWHSNHNHRSLPWKGEKDPYKIWLSEIILQQTRALQGLPYYKAFTETYPRIIDLANAADDDVFKLWQGLGYYNRCKNMLTTARYVAYQLNGIFPRTHADILGLKGIGPYTAAAISSFAFGLPHAVVDGNVYRVLSRYFGIATPFDSTAGKQLFASLARQLLYEQQSAAYNQAIMDLGATICTPANPQCNTCPFKANCHACKQDAVELFPVRSKKITVKERHFNYLFFTTGDKVWLQKRLPGDIWENLYQPYLIETPTAVSELHIIENEPFKELSTKKPGLEYIGHSKQRLTHQQIFFKFHIVRLTEQKDVSLTDGMWVSISELKKLAFPKTLASFLKKYFILLR